MLDRLPVLLLQLRDAIADVGVLVEGVTRDSLNTDLRSERAITMSLVILAQLTAKIEAASPAFIAAHPDVPWIEIRGLRNRIAHAYFEVDLDIIWHAATESVPELAAALATTPPFDKPP